MPAVEGVTSSATPRTRPPPAVFAMVLFVASELMFFGGLFAAYFTLRGRTATWPPTGVELELPVTAVATVLLAVSSVTMHGAVARAGEGARTASRGLVAATFALGTAFLAIEGYELATAGFSVSSHAYGSLFFTMLGAHGVHLLVGLALLVFLGSGVGPGDGEAAGRAEAVSYYWHFVDVVWLAIFSTIYLVR